MAMIDPNGIMPLKFLQIQGCVYRTAQWNEIYA